MSANRSPAPPAELLRRWRALAVPPEDPQAAATRRTRMVGEVAACIRASSQRLRGRRTRRRVVAGLALAAAVCLGVGLWRSAAEPPSAPPGSASPGSIALGDASARLVANEGTVVATVAGHATLVGSSPVGLTRGDEISTAPDGVAALELRGRAQVKLHGATRLRVLRTELSGQRLALRTGKLYVSVRKQAPGQKLSIETPDSEIRVVGTVFTVEWHGTGDDGQSATLVSVERGKVWVIRRGGARASVAAGQRWSSNPRSLSAAQGDSKPLQIEELAVAAGHASKRPSQEPTTVESELAAQNALYRAALGARNARDDARALTLFEQFLARYPNSPLQQEAQVERFRVLKRMGRYADAARQARRYLAEHDSGFARDEARELVLEPTVESD